MIDRLLRLLENLLALGLLFIAATVVVQVVLSNFFGGAIVGGNEIITKLFIYLTTVGSAVAIGKREHIAITFATDSLSPSLQRAIDFACVLLVATVNGVVLVYSFHWIRTTGHYLMPTTQLPRSVAQLSIPLGAGLAMLFCFFRLFWANSAPHRTENQ